MIDYALLTPFIGLAVLIALVFDFYNGVNDAANSIATVVATRALPAAGAVGLAAVFNFAGAFLGTAVAKTVGKGVLDVDLVTTEVILGAVLGGIVWTALASHFGIPISVSHALIGGLIGSGLAAAGAAAVLWPSAADWDPILSALVEGAAGGGLLFLAVANMFNSRRLGPPTFAGVVLGSAFWLVLGIITGRTVITSKLAATLTFLIYSPVVGFILAYAFTVAVVWIVRRQSPGKTNRVFRRLQLVSASFFSLSHGTNDAQKTMGVITALLFANGVVGSFEVPWEVIVAAASAIALGTFVGGYKVVRTMGHRLTHLDPSQGFVAETSGALGLFFLAGQGVPVSTTHTIAGSIMGVGATRSVHAVSWGLARSIVSAWIITIPATAVVAGLCFYGVRAIVGAV